MGEKIITTLHLRFLFICFQKKSREESHGAGSGVEILENQPYTEGPGGNGQYTYKIYHIGSHLPGNFVFIYIQLLG